MADKFEISSYAVFEKTRGYYKVSGLGTEKASTGTSDMPAYDYFAETRGCFQDTTGDSVDRCDVAEYRPLERSVKSYEKSLS